MLTKFVNESVHYLIHRHMAFSAMHVYWLKRHEHCALGKVMFKTYLVVS